MQNPNEDTEWNDVLRAKGIIPPKQEEATITEDTVVQVHKLLHIYCSADWIHTSNLDTLEIVS